MQSGKVYLKGGRWYFRYQAPVVHDGKKVWRDKYINLGPRTASVQRAPLRKNNVNSSAMHWTKRRR